MISVCLASYNGEKYIKEQIESILQQLSVNDELIVSDDGSTDHTLSIIAEIGDPRIKIYFHKSEVNDLGCYSRSHYLVTRNFECALSVALGDYIFLADQDDVWESDKVSVTLAALQKYELVMSNYSIIDGGGKVICASHYRKNPISYTLVGNLIRMPFHGCCMAFTKDLLKEVLPFPKKLVMHDNWIGLCAQMRHYDIGYISKPLIKYRRHQLNVSPSFKKSKNPLWFKLWYRAVLLVQAVRRVCHCGRNCSFE